MTRLGIPGNAPGRHPFYDPTPEQQEFERLCETELDLTDPDSIRALAKKAPSEIVRAEFNQFADELEGWLKKADLSID